MGFNGAVLYLVQMIFRYSPLTCLTVLSFCCYMIMLNSVLKGISFPYFLNKSVLIIHSIARSLLKLLKLQCG